MASKLFKLAGISSTQYAIAAYEGGSIVIFNVTEDRLLSQCLLHREPLFAFDINAALDFGVSGGADNRLCRFSLQWNDAGVSILCDKITEIASSGIGDIKLRADQKLFAAGGWDGK